MTIGEAVSDATIQMHLPVDSGPGHFCGEPVPLFGGDDRILAPLADQNLPADQACVIERRGGETRVKADGAGNIRATARGTMTELD